jgi:class 3 adenylate cyclase/TolB-like protein
MSPVRRLAAILAADVVGFHSRIDADLGGTLRELEAIRPDLLDPTIAVHNGRLLRKTGDLLLVEFDNVVEALRCATHLQRTIAEHNRNLPAEKRIEFRIGIHQGDVVIQDDHLFGDGVNIARGLEGLAQPGGICLSARAKEDAEGKLAVQFEDMGEQRFKNRSRPIRTYQIPPGGASSIRISEKPTRRLTAILAADVAGYSRLMGADEEGTHERLKDHLGELVEPKIAEHRGRIVKNTGDGFLAEFPSVVDAVRCAVEVQRGMGERNAATPADRRIEFRVGINLGDVIAEPDDIYGDGVNLAARLEAMAEPGGICVSRVVRDQVRDRLGYTFEDMGEQQVKNIARPVRMYRVGDRASLLEQPVGTSPPPLPLPDKPSIAVLPFQNMSGDPEQEYFADGMVEEITTALSRVKWLFVIARNSSFTYKGQAIDVKQVGRELGVRYVLEGSVRKAGERVRITAQLIDAVADIHIWADRFDGPLEDVFELQDQVATSVAGVIEPTLQAAEIRRSAQRPTKDLTAYDLYLRALALAFTWEKDAILQALGLLEQAVERDPHYAPALAQTAARHYELHVNGWADDLQASRRKGIDFARRALQAAGDDPDVLSATGFMLAYFGEEVDVAIGLVDRGLKFNPNSAPGWQRSAWLRLWTGQTEPAIRHFETSLRLDPRERRANPFMGIGVAHFFARRFEEARTTLLQSLHEKPNWAPTYRFLASCYAHMGRLDEAREAVERLRSLTNLVVPSATHWRSLEHRELYLSGLRLAAGEER